MVSNDRKLIAVIGATGKQGGGVVRALQASGQFKVRPLTRAPGKHRDLAEEVVEADLDRPETLKAVFGQKGMNELIYLVGLYSLVSTTLNGFNVPVPEHE